ncbi:MAG: hypothetical protein ACJA1A_002271 [Saprospiraceae bacterium]|jgi:hypothetical protein
MNHCITVQNKNLVNDSSGITECVLSMITKAICIIVSAIQSVQFFSMALKYKPLYIQIQNQQ